MSIHFNLLKEIYLKKSNRDILVEVLQYIPRRDRVEILKGVKCYRFDVYLCENCFIRDELTGIQCSIEDTYWRTCDVMFCDNCREQHNRKYTKLIEIVDYFYEGTDYLYFSVEHDCEFSLTSILCHLLETPYIKISKNDYKIYKECELPDSSVEVFGYTDEIHNDVTFGVLPMRLENF